MTEPGVSLENVSFSIGKFALENVSFEVRHGEYFVLTGPNGAGKTILLKLIAGLLRPASGCVRLGDHVVTDLPPWNRNIGYVPQEGLLFPNYTVAKNIDFGLRMRHLPTRDQEREVDRIAELLDIAHLLDRRIHGLSGGERQKVALARALVLDPQVLLLDEPVSAIDESARDSLCRELKRVQTDLAVTTIHVSHNRKETALVADRVGLLRDGAMLEPVSP